MLRGGKHFPGDCSIMEHQDFLKAYTEFRIASYERMNPENPRRQDDLFLAWANLKFLEAYGFKDSGIRAKIEEYAKNHELVEVFSR